MRFTSIYSIILVKIHSLRKFNADRCYTWSAKAKCGFQFEPVGKSIIRMQYTGVCWNPITIVDSEGKFYGGFRWYFAFDKGIFNSTVCWHCVCLRIIEFALTAVQNVARVSGHHAVGTFGWQTSKLLVAKAVRSVPPNTGKAVMVTVDLMIGYREINVSILIKVCCYAARGRMGE